MSEDYEMMCGIEIHQQLDTKKLFCSCDSVLHEEGTGAIYRRQRPTTSEMGEIDRAALMQFQKHLGYRYQCCQGSSCLVELDEEPPHECNPDAMDIALTFSEMLGANIIVLNHLHKACLIVVEESHQAFGKLGSEIALGGVAQNGFHPVVSRNDDEALGVHRKDIETRHAIVGHHGISQFSLGRFHGGVDIHKLDAQRFGSFHIDRFGLQHPRKDECHQRKKE